MSTAVDEIFDGIAEHEQFFQYIRDGAGKLNAALAVGWTPRQLNALLRDREFRELYDLALEESIESLEEVAYKLAKAGNTECLKLYLFCKAADRGWRPPTQRVAVDKNVKHEITVVASTVEAAKALLSQAEPAALQPGSPLDAIVDAEVVDDGD